MISSETPNIWEIIHNATEAFGNHASVISNMPINENAMYCVIFASIVVYTYIYLHMQGRHLKDQYLFKCMIFKKLLSLYFVDKSHFAYIVT